MYKVKSRVEFDAAHFLLNSNTPCDVLHGHRWAVDVTLKSDTLTEEGFVVNFVVLKGWMKEMVDNLDHNLVNFYTEKPTAENLCTEFFLFIHDKLAGYNREKGMDVLVDKVEIAETPNNVSAFSLRELGCTKEKLRRAALRQWADPGSRDKVLKAIREANRDPVLRKMRSIRMRKANPMSRRDVVDKMLRSLMKSRKVLPNEGEKMLISFFADNGIPLTFCGDGSFILDGRIPDFVNYDKKVVVEYNGRFWHSANEWTDACDDSKDRVRFFAERGYTCYIIWDDEFESARVKAKVVRDLKKLLK